MGTFTLRLKFATKIAFVSRPEGPAALAAMWSPSEDSGGDGELVSVSKHPKDTKTYSNIRNNAHTMSYYR